MVSALKPRCHMATNPPPNWHTSNSARDFLLGKLSVMTIRALEKETGLHRGLISGIAHGKRRASDRIIDILNEKYKLHIPHNTVPVQPCPHCGQAPLRKRGCACQDAGRKRRRLAPPLVRLVAGLLASGHLVVKGG